MLHGLIPSLHGILIFNSLYGSFFIEIKYLHFKRVLLSFILLLHLHLQNIFCVKKIRQLLVDDVPRHQTDPLLLISHSQVPQPTYFWQ